MVDGRIFGNGHHLLYKLIFYLHSSLTHTYMYTQSQVTTTLVSMCDRSTVDKNIVAAMCPLTLKEQTVMDEIMKRYFTPLQLTHWEGVEEEHKRQLQELKK